MRSSDGEGVLAQELRNAENVKIRGVLDMDCSCNKKMVPDAENSSRDEGETLFSSDSMVMESAEYAGSEKELRILKAYDSDQL